MKSISFHAKVHGAVQGVAFRFYTKQRATELGLGGWVRNLPNGSVEVRALGDRSALEELARWLNDGPPAACVDRVEMAWEEVESDASPFRVRT
ncbi:MAG: acylphosphatase [Polyangia bacterium]